ncbi:MAG: Nif3-like dinuclear metal center hexameric protein [Gammaproteobacteria bacterium]|nr:Nif3-like dinuclear metal center hexameric protein [Gammaproteobacteria bacterium]MBU1447484.1 Nif3-like dinuclear metal center hexameric protein [Gammaproteobacteria bacterium]
MQLIKLSDYIGSELAISRFRDYCPNGIQVEGRSEVQRIATGVTASQAVLQAAAAWGADAILVHHGYFWRNEDAVITGIKKRRIAFLLEQDISLLAYHLPLDAHPLWGNNAQLAARLGLVESGRFGEQDVAWHGTLAKPLGLKEFAKVVAEALQFEPLIVEGKVGHISRIAWCSGAAQGYFEQAIALGVNVFLTGEISESNVHMARESGVTYIAAGHHATERYGVQALGVHLAERFGLEHRFFDEEVPV